MKKMKLLLLTLFSLFNITGFAQEKTDSIKVYGNCGMCKNRIEKAAKLEGVTAAAWREETKMITVTYNPEKVKLDEVQKKVAAVGHDTEKFTAEAAIYNKLPGCCKYDRKAKVGNDHGHQH